jgi:hypothetical protein
MTFAFERLMIASFPSPTTEERTMPTARSAVTPTLTSTPGVTEVDAYINLPFMDKDKKEMKRGFFYSYFFSHRFFHR